MFRLALGQILVVPGAKAANLARMDETVRAAADEGADCIVLPEAMSVGWTDASSSQLADEIPAGETAAALRRAAAKYRMYVCSGLVERADGSVFNSALLVSPDGEILLQHRKIWELEIGQRCYSLGRKLSVVQTPIGAVGLLICADASAPDRTLLQALALMGADIILSPCAWAVPPEYDNEKEPYGQMWLDAYQAVARQYRIWIAGVSNVGPIASGAWAGYSCIGSSMLISANGSVVARGPYGSSAEALLVADVSLEPRPAWGTAWEAVWR